MFGYLEMQFVCKARKITDFLPSSLRFENYELVPQGLTLPLRWVVKEHHVFIV